MSLTAATFSDQVFNVKNLDEAKRIILTQAPGMTPEQRWVRETPYLVDLITSNIPLEPDSLVLDFGCGVGRIPKELITNCGCRCVGVDTSDSMLAIGMSYVGSERYIACSPAMLRFLDLQFDLVLSVWALQHVRNLQLEIDAITESLKDGGMLFIVNEKALSKRLILVKEGTLNPAIMAKGQPESAFWAIYEK
jgi:SAM-dependent methyltransferase